MTMISSARTHALLAALLMLFALIGCGGGISSPNSGGAAPAQAPSSSGTAPPYGKWSTLPYTMPINPIHAALLHTGKVLIVSGSGNDPNNAFPSNTNPDYESAIWDPQAGKITTQRVAWDMFCNGMSVMADGRVLINGGTATYGALAPVGGASDIPFTGLGNSSVFDPATGSFSVAEGPNQGNTTHGRWYPTLTELGDGRMMSTSGLDENGNTHNTSEIYTTGQGWGAEIPGNPSGLNDPSFTFAFPLYPRMHLLPSGQVFYSAPSSATLVFDPSHQAWSFLAWTIYGGAVEERTYGSSVLLPLTPANNYDPKVIIMGGDNPATNTTEIIDLGQISPKWQEGPAMAQARAEMEATLLPNGKVLVSGGSATDEDATTASLQAELYDPATNSFSSAGANSFPRLYHNVQLLLPDGTVFLAGGNPQQGVYEKHIEIYQPAYLFNSDGSAAMRPTISSAPASITYGSTFAVQNGGLTATLPQSSTLTPPGYYLLFLVNKIGVPSIAKFVQVTGAPAPVAAIEFKPLTAPPSYVIHRPRHVTESPLPLRKQMHIH